MFLPEILISRNRSSKDMYVLSKTVSLCHYLVKAGLKLMSLLHRSPKCWNYRHAQICIVQILIFDYWLKVFEVTVYWLNTIKSNKELRFLIFLILRSFEPSPLSRDRFQCFSLFSNYEEYFEESFGAVLHRKFLWRTRQAPWLFLCPRCGFVLRWGLLCTGAGPEPLML